MFRRECPMNGLQQAFFAYARLYRTDTYIASEHIVNNTGRICRKCVSGSCIIRAGTSIMWMNYCDRVECIG